MMSEFSLPLQEFFFVRHGQTDHNEAGIASTEDTSLTEEGRRQARELLPLLEYLGGRRAFHVVSSAMQRADETAHLATGIAEGEPLDADPDPRLNERANGVLGGRVKVDRLHKIMQHRRTQGHDDHFHYPGSQTRAMHFEQVTEGMHHHLSACPEGKKLLVFAHHGTMQRAAEAVGIAITEIKNATLYRFTPDRETGRWTIAELGLAPDGALTERPVAVSAPRFIPPSATGATEGVSYA